MKKGFTLVEIAIVLVIIGIIIGLAIKGKSLIDTAKFQQELAKMNQISVGVSTYYSKHNKFPYIYQNESFVDTDKLVEEGLISAKDLKTELSDDNKFGISVIKSKENKSGLKFFASAMADEELAIYIYNRTNMPEVLCKLETFLDDKNIFDGDLRLGMWGVNTDMIQFDNINIDYDNCEKSKIDNIFVNNFSAINYRIF